MKKNKKEIIAVIVIVLFVIAAVPKVFQNDTFYTVTIGRDILKYGFDGQDHYSWISGMSYTSPHWLFDVVNYLIYNVFNFDGLYVFVCILASVQMLLFYWILRKKNVGFLTAFCGTLVVVALLKDNFTDRAQMLTYMLFLLEVYFLDEFMKKKKAKYVLGIFLISLVIANCHVATWPLMFILLLPHVGEYVFGFYKIDNVAKMTMKKTQKKLEKLKKKEKLDNAKIESLEKSIESDKKFLDEYKPKENAKIIIEKNENAKYLILIALVILLAGFLTPTGSLPFVYFIKTSMGNAMNYINEHSPIVVATSVEFVAFMIISIACVAFTDSKLKASDGLLLIGFYFMTFISKRHMILLILLCGPILIKMIDDFIKKYTAINRQELTEKEKKEANESLEHAKKVFFVVIICVALFFAVLFVIEKKDDDYIDETSYPVQAAEFILNYIEENDIEDGEFRLYNEYNYGSYLLYKGIPVFIDSRAEQPYTKQFNEGITIFDDYAKVTSGLISYTELFEEYDINYAIVKTSSLEYVYMKEDERCIELYSDDNFVFYKYEQ